MNTIALTLPVTRASHGATRAVKSLAARLRHQWKLRETRRYLSQMDDHMLQDLGVSRAQALFELDGAGSQR